jgi:hypothetical protein
VPIPLNYSERKISIGKEGNNTFVVELGHYVNEQIISEKIVR